MNMNDQSLQAISDSLLAELEEAMPQGISNDTGHRRRAEDPATEDEGLDALDALLAESVGALEADKQYKLDRAAKAKAYSGMSKEEADYCNSRMHAFEMLRVWQPESAISVWHQYECQCCGRERMVFSRYMEYHTSRVNPTARRWLTVTSTKFEAMPVKDVRQVPTCPRCSEWELDPRLMTNLNEVLA